MATEWHVRAGLSPRLLYIHGDQLYAPAGDGTNHAPPQELPPRPARDVLRALLAYSLEQIDVQTAREVSGG